MASPSILSSHSKSAPTTSGSIRAMRSTQAWSSSRSKALSRPHHGNPVLDRGEEYRRCRADPLGGRVRCLEVRMFLLDAPQLPHQSIEIGIRDLGRVLLVVLLVVIGDLGPQLLDALGWFDVRCRLLVSAGILVVGLLGHCRRPLGGQPPSRPRRRCRPCRRGRRSAPAPTSGTGSSKTTASPRHVQARTTVSARLPSTRAPLSSGRSIHVGRHTAT